MTDEKTSVAEETKEELRTPSEETGAQEESLDDILKEFEQGVEETKPDSTETEPSVADLAKQLQELQQAQQRQTIDQELTDIGRAIRGDLPEEAFDDELMRNWMESRAAKDQRIQTAFLNRAQQPTAWNNVVKGLARDFQGKFSSLPDKQATEDRDAVQAAVRGAQTKAPETDDDVSYNDVRNLSDDEAEKWRREQARKLGF